MAKPFAYLAKSKGEIIYCTPDLSMLIWSLKTHAYNPLVIDIIECFADREFSLLPVSYILLKKERYSEDGKWLEKIEGKEIEPEVEVVKRDIRKLIFD